jgi:predicted peptidase
MMKKTCLLVALAIIALHVNGFAKVTKPASKEPHYKYLEYAPLRYDSVTAPWPLIIYLHGKSCTGTNLNKLRTYGIPFYVDRGMAFDAVVISPQCPPGRNWTTENWFEPLYKEILSKYRIDTTRIYLTGMSMGGFGAWDLAIKYPTRFAAVVPLCGGGRPQQVAAIKDVPVWVFHGNKDVRVPIRRSVEMVNALRACNGKVKFTVLKGQGHDIHRTFADERIYQWMYQFKTGTNAFVPAEECKTNDTLVMPIPKKRMVAKKKVKISKK